MYVEYVQSFVTHTHDAHGQCSKDNMALLHCLIRTTCILIMLILCGQYLLEPGTLLIEIISYPTKIHNRHNAPITYSVQGTLLFIMF